MTPTTELVTYLPAVDLRDFRLVAEPTLEALSSDGRKFFGVMTKGTDMQLLGTFLLGVTLLKAKHMLGSASRGAHAKGESGFTDWKKATFPNINNHVLLDSVNFTKAVCENGKKAKMDFLPNEKVIDFQLPENPEELRALLTGIHNTMDGKTMTAICRGLGRIREAQKPGENSKGGSKKNTAETAAEMRRIALEDSGRMGAVVRASNRNFFLLTDTNDLEVDAQIAVLEFALKLRRKWLATPKGKRDAKEIEAMLEGSPIK